MPLTRHPTFEPRLVLVTYELYMTAPDDSLFAVFVSDDVPRQLEPDVEDGMEVILRHRDKLEKIGSDLFDSERFQPDGLSVLVRPIDVSP